jgi:hypothetical protein
LVPGARPRDPGRLAEAGVDHPPGRRGVEGAIGIAPFQQLRPRRADDQQRRRVQRSHDVGEEGGEPEGDPVDIVDQQDRRFVEHRFEELPHRPPGLVDDGQAAVDRGQVGESLDHTVGVGQVPD